MTERTRPLQTRFFVNLLCILLGLSIFYGYVFHKMAKGVVETEAAQKAQLILDQAVAIQSYIRDTVRPTLYGVLADDRFVLEAMSTSYVTRRIMSDLNRSSTQNEYRRVAIGARNPDFEARGLDLEIIERFRASDPVRPLVEYRTINGNQCYLAAHAVVFDESCMHCHGDPLDAPKEIVAAYGSERGFHRTPGEIAGLDLVVIPVSSSLALVNTATLALFSLFVLGTLAFFGLIQASFQRLVIHNLKRVTEKLTRHFRGLADTDILSRLDRSDQIDTIGLGIEELAGHLQSARSQLQDYAANLEAKVAERTEELKKEVRERQADVTLFVDMLQVLNSSRQRRQVLLGVVERLARHFGAEAAAIVCVTGVGAIVVWPESTDTDAVAADWKQVVSTGEAVFEAGLAMVAVPSGDVERGVLCLRFAPGHRLEPRFERLLCSVGQQLGIALDSLDVLQSHLQQKNLLRSVVNGISDPVALLDSSGEVVLSNETGRFAEDLPLFLDHGQGRRALLAKVLADAEPMSFERSVDGGRVFAVSLYPLPASQRGNGRVVVYAREITAEKQMAESIRQHEKMATVGRLASGLAHEINNPLGVILCYAELLLRGTLEDRQRADLEIIISHTRQAKKILDDLLAFARSKKNSGSCDPSSVLPRLARVFSVQASARQTEVELDLHPDLPPVSIADSGLEQILGNLLLNALDAVPAGSGRVRLSAEGDAARREIVFTVMDNGPGIPESDLKRIFDPFFTTKEVGRGTGLGLAVVYGLVGEAGGEISVENNQGAMFTVRLPMARPPAPEETHAQN